MSPVIHKSIERTAKRIEDPIARLQYLKHRMASTDDPAPRWRPRKFPVIALVLLAALLLSPGFQALNADRKPQLAYAPPVPAAPAGKPASADTVPKVWLVDKSKGFETYSNGLRIDDSNAVRNDSRLFYPVYQRAAIDPAQPEWRSEPAGIVYHTTESDQVPFDENQNGALKRIGRQVLTYVRDKRCYHFFIDRFGQVFRVVEESDVAYHAGSSIWADDRDIYVNLNASFLGIAFETQTQRGEDMPSANAAQIHAARVLTEMLRSKYNIPAANCVTHAQVSVNPDNMLVGYHTDWAGNFPFVEMGLSDNYVTPPASIYAFGFEYDPSFVHATGARVWEGLTRAEDQLRLQAAAQGLTTPQYRARLRKKYKEVLAIVKAANEARESTHAS